MSPFQVLFPLLQSTRGIAEELAAQRQANAAQLVCRAAQSRSVKSLRFKMTLRNSIENSLGDAYKI